MLSSVSRVDHQFLLGAGAGLAIMIAASVFSRRTGVAAPLLLVALGNGASYLPSTPEIILAGVLPALLYSSAVQLPVLDVRRNLSLVSWLSVVLVIVSAVVIGAVVHAIFPSISFALATALGAVVSPTDAVAATAIGHRAGFAAQVDDGAGGRKPRERRLGPGRAADGGRRHRFQSGATILDFAWAVIGAAVIGLLGGLLTALLRQRLDDPVLNTTISFAVPFRRLFPAEQAMLRASCPR